MKKIVTTLVIAVLCYSAALPAFAQNRRNLNTQPSILQGAKFLNSAAALTDGNGVWLEWQTGTEKEIIGFQVYRVAGGEKQLVSPILIPGEYLSPGGKKSSGRQYNQFDPQGGFANGYFVEAVYASGQRQQSRTFYPQMVKNLAEFAGTSSSDLQKRSAGSNPSVQTGGLSLPADLEAESRTSSLVPDDAAATQKWVAAQPGVKIGVKQDGLYRVTRAELQAAGFNVNASPALWSLYADGVEQGIIVDPNGDYIEFFGRGLNIPESDTRVYFLVVGAQAGRRMGNTVARGFSAKVGAPSFQQVTVKKDRLTYLSQILNGDAENFFGSFVSSVAGDTIVNLPAVDTSVATVTVEVGIQGYSFLPYQHQWLLNGTEIGTTTGFNRELMTGTFTVPTSLLQEGANTVRAVSQAGNGGIAFTDSVKVTYARRYQAEQDALEFYTQNYRTARVQGFTSPVVRVFDLTDTTSPNQVSNFQIMPVGNTHEVVMPSARSRVYYAVAAGGIRTAASIIQNAPSTLSTPAHNGRMVIISYKNWMTQSESWANYRRAGGMSVEVVNVEDVHDEFGYGVRTADSIRAFLNYAKNNWQTAPDYVLLMGDTTYDGRNYFAQGDLNFVPAKLVDTAFTQTGSDDALADFNDDGLAEIAVGRIPARNATEVTTMLAKTTAFEQGLGTAPIRGALCASDEPNGFDFEALCTRVFQSFPASIPVTHINRPTPDSRTQLLASINAGKYIVNYSGHGTVAAWAGNWFNRTDVPALTNTNANQTIWVMLTCLNGYYVDAFVDSLAETLVKKSEGAAVASWASSGETTPDVQEIMATRFYQQVGNSTTMNRLGDLANDAKTTIVGGRDVRLSWVLLGDPAMKVKNLPGN